MALNPEPEGRAKTRPVRSPRPKGPVNWTFGGGGYRHVWVHGNGSLFFGAARESDEGDAGVQSIGSAVVEVTPSDYFELIARQTPPVQPRTHSADELAWFAIGGLWSKKTVPKLPVLEWPPSPTSHTSQGA